MVYDWESHKDILRGLYVDDKKPIEDIITHMRMNYNFTPSKRAYQAQFRRWNFPSKHQPALKNEQLVARVKELWERNLSQAEMLRVLNEEDGFSIKSRELNRLMEERKRKMETESAERWATKKRRRRTRQYAGMPADPPGPPRFPSETTLGESQVILGLDKPTYNAVREKFQSICSAAGVVKKTVAGPEAWEAAKESLVGEFFQLQDIMWSNKDSGDNNDMDRRRLALDVICSDVTKRMRSGGDKELLLADAKNILSLNPQESREVRAAFYKILQADGFTSKVAMGPERWKELKQRWIDESQMLQRILSRLHDKHSHEMKSKAVEALARDVMKRLRDDQTRRKGAKPRKRGVSEGAAADGGGGGGGGGVGGGGFEDNQPGMDAMGEDASGFASEMLVQTVANTGGQHGQHAHSHPSRILADHHLIHPQMGMHGPFVDPNQHYLAGPSPLAAPPPFDPSQPTASPAVFQTMPATNGGTIPIYLRLDHENRTSIAFLTSHSVEELCQLAEQKVPGSRCVRVEGLLKMPDMEGGQYIPLQIQNDDQLSAYLSHGGPPTFNVRLAF
ncbi:hypothetical protein VPNG_00505 [Cytospora leucostoma]|uniref:Uncharacterized protein n=1 Tax=Cytospora leucostoma TaxID=1230097 RepID=A0A423XP43_9PEZI|nr:hypothetical protein VPNG_00505 [Cytospora leucostoma]